MNSPKQLNEEYFLENLLSQSKDWHSIPPVVHTALKTVAELLKSHSSSLSSINNNYLLKRDAYSLLEEKLDKCDFKDQMVGFQTTLEARTSMIDDKVSKSDFYDITNNKLEYEEAKVLITDATKKLHNQLNTLYDEFIGSIRKVVTKEDLEELKVEVKGKVNFDEVETVVKDKANAFLSKTLKKKADKSQLSKKADLKDLESLHGVLETKADSYWAETLSRKLSELEKGELKNTWKKMEKQGREFWEQLTDSSVKHFEDLYLKTQLQVDTAFSEIKKQVETFKKYPSFNKKVKEFEGILLGIKQENCDMIESVKNQNKLELNKLKETLSSSKSETYKVFCKLENSVAQLEEELKELRDYSKSAFELSFSSKTKDYTAKELREIKTTLQEVIRTKTDTQDTEHLKATINSKVDFKLVEEMLSKKNQTVISTLESIKQELNTNIKIIESSLSQKTQEALKSSSEQLENKLRNKASLSELNNLLEQFSSFKAFLENSDQKFNKVYTELSKKANPEYVDSAVNSKLNTLSNKLEKQEFWEFQQTFDTLVNTIFSELCLGRWHSSGEFKNSCLCWDFQSINTSHENFCWEPRKSSIKVVEAGTYEVGVGVFCPCSVHLLANGRTLKFIDSNYPVSFIHYVNFQSSTYISLSCQCSKLPTAIITIRKLS